MEVLQHHVPTTGFGLEVGVGTGRFALPLGIEVGVDTSRNMLKVSRKENLLVFQAMGEFLPFANGHFDFCAMITVVCFVEDVLRLFREANRVIKSNGKIIVGFIDRDSVLGKQYESNKANNRFYQDAYFHSVSDIAEYLQQAGFHNFDICQTILDRSQDAKAFEVLDGYGKGAFISICAKKQ